MAIAVVFEFPNQPIDDYLKVFEIGGAAITDQPKRRQHACYRTEDGFTVLDVWESEEAFAQFGGVIGPVMEQLGLSTPPRIFPVQRTVSNAGVVNDD